MAKYPRAKVVHVRESYYDVYIGRKSGFNWGNPYSHLKGNTLAQYKVSTVEEAVQKYEEWLLKQPELVAKVKSQLRGKILGCFCKGKATPDAPCHGDVLLRLANEGDETPE